jgi:hypothetical protein
LSFPFLSFCSLPSCIRALLEVPLISLDGASARAYCLSGPPYRKVL